MNAFNDLSENLVYLWEEMKRGDEEFSSTLETIIHEHYKMTENKAIKSKKNNFIEKTIEEIYSKTDSKTSYNQLIEAIYKIKDNIHWYPNPTFKETEIAIKRENYCANLVGKAFDIQANPYTYYNFYSEKIIVGLFLMGKNQFYPAHHHPAWETWVILSGSGKWKVEKKDWEIKKPGDCFTFTENESHSVKTLDEPILAVWAWTGELSSWAKWTL